MQSKERDAIYFPVAAISIVMLMVNVYWFAFPMFKQIGGGQYLSWHNHVLKFLWTFEPTGIFDSQFKLKGYSVFFIFLATIMKSGKPTKASWWWILAMLGVGLTVFFFPFNPPQAFPFAYTAMAVGAYPLIFTGFALAGRKATTSIDPGNDKRETFLQCEKKIENEYSFNLPTRYRYQKKWHNGWINVINPFMGSMILGNPGVGKSYVFFESFFEQALRKAYTVLCYDYKMPALTYIVYNEYLLNKEVYKEKYGVDVQFCILNFDNPRQGMRCNPLKAEYLTDQADAHEVADLIMNNVNPNAVQNEDFFTMSAKVYIAALVWFLKKHEGGRFCSFPHLIELMGKNYKAVLQIMREDRELTIMVQPFIDALEGGAQEQLQGQIASARMPLLKFPSTSLYWALTGDDFTLDINNPDRPKIVCIGNNPDRQAIYGTALALYTSRIIKLINHPKNAAGKRTLPCLVALDEFPTIFLKGIDNLIATARSNRVAVMLGAQDRSQIVRDYKRENAEVVLNTVGNVFSGRVNSDTAKHMAETFGREFREQQSQTTGSDSGDTVSTSFQQREILPQSRIETLSQGTFFGKVADEVTQPIDQKLFCAKVLIDKKAREKHRSRYVDIPDFGAQKYFDDEGVERRCREKGDVLIRSYVADRTLEEDRQLHQGQPGYIQPTGAALYLNASKKVQAMTPDEKETIMQEIIAKMKDMEMHKKMQENYDKITEDITSIFAYYGIDLDEYEKKNTQGSNPAAPAMVSVENPEAETV